ncbi:MAG: GNAT family N-acetyltransferase [Candidatus Odinarchaeia archaeon]
MTGQIDKEQIDSNVTYSIYESNLISPVAVAKLEEAEDYITIKVINVLREYRSRGYGTAILNEIVRTYLNKKIVVTTFAYLIEWYMKFGFRVTDQHGNIYSLERIPSN